MVDKYMKNLQECADFVKTQVDGAVAGRSQAQNLILTGE
jgi:hypothetical protein